MSDFGLRILSIDAPAIAAAVLSALVCGLLGNWLVLRRSSLMGDAISHAVLPGIVGAFLITGSRAPLPMFAGALIAAGLTALLSEAIRRIGRIDPGAAMGVVFTGFFAFGVLLIEQASARQVDLDADCVLYGSLETLFWLPPSGSDFWRLETLGRLPTPVWTLAVTSAVTGAVLHLLRKELALASFDAGLAAALGFRPGLMHAILMILVATAAIASFEAVGSILVVAMLICPAASARLWTDVLRTQTRLSAIFAVSAALLGYVAAATAPKWLGTTHALGAAGTIATTTGVLLAVSAIASPSHGVIAGAFRRRALSVTVAREDLLGLLHRLAEEGRSGADETMALAAIGHDRAARAGVRAACARGEVERIAGELRLSQRGADEARAIVRRHRFWESYLVDEVGLAPDHVHDTAERLEHLRSLAPRDRS